MKAGGITVVATYVFAYMHEFKEGKFDWTGDFSEGLCVVRDESGKHGYIDTTGKLIIDYQFQYSYNFENGKAKIQLANLWGQIDSTGKIIVEPTHNYATDW